MTAFGRSLENVYSLLAKGEQARAYEALKKIKTSNWQDLLKLAIAYSFFDKQAVNFGRKCLTRALKIEQSLLFNDFYKSLDYLYKVLENVDLRIDSRIMSLANNSDMHIRFVMGRGLFLSTNYRRAIKALRNLDSSKMNEYYQNLHFSMLANSYARESRFTEAAEVYKLLLITTKKENPEEERLLLAECYLQSGNAELALDNLAFEATTITKEKRLFYMRGVAMHHLHHYQESLTEFRKAYLLYENTAVAFELILAIARLYIDLKEPQKAIDYYEHTLYAIPEHHSQQIRHEFARFLKAHGYFKRSIVLLKELAKDMRYKNKITAELDLAEAVFEMKDIALAESYAKRPYRHGLVGASLLLARISLEKFDYDDAIVYLEQVLGLSEKASSDWLSAQILLAETFAKKRTKSPDRLIMHAKNALDYLNPNDDWIMTLESYLEEARAEAIENRVVN